VFSEHATAVELCLFDDGGAETRVPLTERTGYDWHGHVAGIGPGQRYGYRVHGPYEPERGHRFNPAKLLLDPYARAIDGSVRWEAGNPFAYVQGDDDADDADLVIDDQDDAPAMPRSVVVDDRFDWGDDQPPSVPWTDTVIYEAHVKGFTNAHPGIQPDRRGTYSGLASDAAVDHLRRLGVTAVELLPVHHISDESFLFARGLTNYWGYSPIGFFAPYAGYAATGRGGEQVREFKAMVKALHRAGIEVLLDVVYNHTAEGDHLGPNLSFRGIDNACYYRLRPDRPRYYSDVTGTGNSFNPSHPQVRRLIIDSLRYWVSECHVDGFRFDLATTLARGDHGFDPRSALLEAIAADAVLSGVKLIAEPWDLGPDGYQVGAFPAPWSEWNGVFRDEVRDFWRGAAPVARLAERMTGSGDVYARSGRGPTSSINFVTAHDGFTLADLVSYDTKHNHMNLQGNGDGTDDNRSWNCGAEGPTDDVAIGELRARQQRNLLTTLLLSQGVPMVLAGDELGRSQGGNNNAWCQDNEISWLDWTLPPDALELLSFTRRLIALRRGQPAFRHRRFLRGPSGTGGDDPELPDSWWFNCGGRAMTGHDWDDPHGRVVGLFLNGRASAERDAGDSFLLLVNGDDDDVTFTLPMEAMGRRWSLELATADPAAQPGDRSMTAAALVPCTARSVTVLKRTDIDQDV